jgi:hypothetical protein
MSASTEHSNDRRVSRLIEINHRIAQAELNADVEYMDGVLADDLQFRRANGSIVGKRKYLDDLPTTKYAQVVAEDVKIHAADASCVATVQVHARGTRPDGTEFSGVFSNVRLFVPGGPEGWQVRVWINTPVD